jgi:hypothetical protein
MHALDMGTTTHEHGDDLLLLACITVGAVLGFSLTGGAAVGTAIGAGAGIALLARHHARAAAKRRRD